MLTVARSVPEVGVDGAVRSASRIALFGRVLFGAGVALLGVDHFILKEFVTGRAPDWPAMLPGEVAFVYLTGAAFIALGGAMAAGRQVRAAALTAAAIVFWWALLRHLPVIATAPLLGGAWTDATKAVRFVGGALAVAVLPPSTIGASRLRWPPRSMDAALLLAARIMVGLTLLINGTQHFLFTPFVAALIPSWFPGSAVFWTYVGGVALIAGGLGLLVRRVARIAALMTGAMIFTWFFVIHVAREVAGVADGIAVFEALATAGMLFVLAGALSAESRLPGESAAGATAES